MTYKERVKEAIDAIDETQVARVVSLLRAATVVYVLGNGGSQANAAHLVLHLRDRGVAAFDMLGDNAWLTAQANDYGYDSAASNFLRVPLDGVLVVLSGSGRSANVLSALATFRGPKVGILGSGGGKAIKFCDVAIVLPQTEYGPVEDAHSVILHMIHEALK